MVIRRPFDDLIDLLDQLPKSNSERLTAGLPGAPLAGSIAKDDIYHLLVWLADWQKTSNPKLDESYICVFASTYAEYDEQERLVSFIDGAGKGREPVSNLCKERGVGLRVLEMALKVPHVVSENWPEKDCMAATAFGMQATAAGGDILGLASISPGNQYHCRALCQQLVDIINLEKRSAAKDDEFSALAISVLEIMKNNAGREVAAMVGALIAARSANLPVLIEGWSGIAALTILTAIAPKLTDHVKIASVECKEQSDIVAVLGMQPVIGGTVNLGAGCGIAVALSAIAPLLNLSGSEPATASF